MQFDGLLKGQPITQIIGHAVRPFAGSDSQAPKTAETFKAQAVTLAVLPAQLQSLNEGQTAHFQRKSVEYFKKLVSQGQINPRTVTQQEFVAKAERLAERDPFSFDWSSIARSLFAYKMVADVRITGNRDRAEREEALYQLQQVREIALQQQEARKPVMSRDQMLISPAALAVSRERAAKRQ